MHGCNATSLRLRTVHFPIAPYFESPTLADAPEHEQTAQAEHAHEGVGAAGGFYVTHNDEIGPLVDRSRTPSEDAAYAGACSGESDMEVAVASEDSDRGAKVRVIIDARTGMHIASHTASRTHLMTLVDDGGVQVGTPPEDLLQ
jgi:hypothetical protein